MRISRHGGPGAESCSCGTQAMLLGGAVSGKYSRLGEYDTHTPLSASPGTIVMSAGLVYFPSKTPLSPGGT